MKAGNMLADLIEHLATSKQSNKAGFYNYRKSSKGQKVSVLLEDTARKEIFFFQSCLLWMVKQARTADCTVI